MPVIKRNPRVYSGSINECLFLDIDGVLLTEASYRRGCVNGYLVPPQTCVDALNRLIGESGAQIVVSSTWRADGLSKMRETLAAWGVVGDVIGCTPQLQKKLVISGYSDLYVSASRGSEIATWLDESPTQHFVILDDEADMGDLMPWLVQTDFTEGLADKHVSQALEVLGHGR